MKKRYFAFILLFIFVICEGIFTFSIKHEGSAGGRVVVIDPGHGTITNSRPNEGTIELQISLKLRDVLSAKGYQVVMTRESNGAILGGATDEYSDNVARAMIANNAGADAIVRLHSDSYSDDKFAIYYPQSQTADSRDKVGPEDPTTIPKSRNLSYQILNSMQENGFVAYPNPVRADTDGGIKPGNYATSANLSISTAISLVEIFGHGSAENMTKYSADETQDKVALALGNAVEQYLNSPESLVAAKPQSKPAPKPAVKKTVVAPKKIEPQKPKFSLDAKAKVNIKSESLSLEEADFPKITHLQKLTFSGTTNPNAVVTISIHSEPINISVTADNEGKWSYTLDPDKLDLELGEHTISAFATDNKVNSDETTLAKFELYALPSTENLPPISSNANSWNELLSPVNILLTVITILLLGFLIRTILKRRRQSLNALSISNTASVI